MKSARSFPTLRVLEDRFEAEGTFAEAQAAFLRPDEAAVRALDARLEAGRIGVVAHYYMDPELQGVLAACRWPHVHISDSLLMADRAVAFAKAGCRAVVVLGLAADQLLRQAHHSRRRARGCGWGSPGC